ncbi:MAG: hypothetical protein ACLFU8_04465 [Anaerolineales bacterium]
MIRQRVLSCLILAWFVLLTLVACGGGDPVNPVALPDPTLTGSPATSDDPAPTAEVAEPTVVAVGGPGAFNLPQPGAHLDLLDRYQAELLTHFRGEQDGQSIERSTHLALTYAGPDAQVTRLEGSATDEPPLFLLAGQVAGTHFVQSAGDAPCTSLVDEQDPETPTFGDPWRELPAVYGAEPVGSETVNDFETEHYTFDQRAIRWAAGSTAQGELWVAKEGGFLVRYRLVMQAPPGVLSATGGEQTWEFDLTPLPEDAQLLPEGCAPVLTDFALLPDAAATLRLPGYLSYRTGSEAAAAIEFYRQELAAAGWEEQDAFNATPERTVLFFVRPVMEDEAVTAQEVAAITLQTGDDDLKVEVQLLRID